MAKKRMFREVIGVVVTALFITVFFPGCSTLFNMFAMIGMEEIESFNLIEDIQNSKTLSQADKATVLREIKIAERNRNGEFLQGGLYKKKDVLEFQFTIQFRGQFNTPSGIRETKERANYKVKLTSTKI
jgi:hypothetical protein